MTKLENSSRQKRAKFKYKADMRSDNSLMPLDVLNILFPRTILEQLTKHKDKRIILCGHNKLKIMQFGYAP